MSVYDIWLSRAKHPHKYISFEPLLGEITVVAGGMSWYIISAQTGPGAIKPQQEWVEKLIARADQEKIPVFLKDNLLRLFPDLPRRQEIPERG